MNTLTIPEIFSNFAYYQDNYLSILQDTAQYHIEIEQAYLNIWPLSEKKLYLGDLLQLWFSEKWLINSTCQLLSNSKLQITKQPIQREHDFYLFQLTGSTFSGANHAQLWSVSEQKIVYVALDSVFKYLCYFESIDRSTLKLSNQIKTSLKTAV